jgi:hypothetical protein
MSGSDYRQWLVETHHQATQDFDRAVTALAGGALGLSFTFMDDIAPDPIHKWLVGTSWALFAAALLATFLSYLASQGVHVKRIADHDAGAEWGRSYLGYTTTALNVLAAIGVVGGFVFLVIFALYNL